jgi:ribosome modulation factor
MTCMACGDPEVLAMLRGQVVYFLEGLSARGSGTTRNANPYKRWTPAWAAWLAGWDESAEEERAMAQADPPLISAAH